ncbi:nucleoside phosphorylase [Enterococcus sp. AD013-P3]|uniref:nucleoside phosphorylase n=1 Tax=Enterococcus sp. AD013-P3 TaxID=3411036 RepID=UPI003B930DE4
MLLEEFDPTPKAIINPDDSDVVLLDYRLPLPTTILCPFSGEIITHLLQRKQIRPIGYTKSINGKSPIYLLSRPAGPDVLVTLAKVGSPACIGTLEDLAPLGITNFIIFGSCGVLKAEQASDQINLPTAALRDEGMSYHYAPPADVIKADPHAIHLMEKVLQRHEIRYEKGLTWTTDAFFRETPKKLAHRKEQGAVFVDMEAAATFAWAQFRGHRLLHFFYSADHIHTKGWDRRKNQRRRHVGDYFDVALLFADELSKTK